jgi:hypothetical protein
VVLHNSLLNMHGREGKRREEERGRKGNRTTQ